MKEHFIDLTDGTRIDLKINFGTMYFLKKSKADKMMKKADVMSKKGKKISDDLMLEIAAKVIYAVLRSNGQKVTFEEALCLMPTDPESLQEVVDAYSEEVEKYKKKEQAKTQMKNFAK